MIVSELKKEARKDLKEKWKDALLIMLLFFVVTCLLIFLTYWILKNTTYGFFANILNIVISISLGYGLLVSFTKLKRNEKVNCLYFIYYACKYTDRVWRIIGRVFWKLLGYIFVWILSLYLMITEFVSLYYGNGMRISYVIEILSVIIFSVLICMKILYYALTNNILYDNTKYKTKEILKESERLMKNHRWDFVKLNLSFAGWFLLGAVFSIGIILLLYFVFKIRSAYLIYIVLYIPLIFLLPYIYTTNICFYNKLLENRRNKK